VTTYLVRPARPTDGRAVRELVRRVRREFHLAVRTGEAGRSGQGLLWVVEVGRGEIVGCCGAAEAADGGWELDTLFLAPEWRGFGLGRSLVERVVRDARRAGAPRIACDVPGQMVEANALLHRLGFEDVGEPGRGARRYVRRLAGVS
jgi:N-acetylglutamate synthase-like GNAT family acetyltransferase